MSPQMRRLLPIIVIAFVAIFFLPQLLKGGKGSKTLAEKDRAALTRDAATRIDKAETAYLAEHGRYTNNLSDLVLVDKQLARNLTVPLRVDIDISSDAKSYLLRVSSDVISLARSRTGGKITTASCRELKSSSGVKCTEPAKAPPKTTTTTG